MTPEIAPAPRLAYAAAHVVMKESYRSVPHSLERPGSAEEIGEHVDWKATLARRALLDARGFGVAEAMDTAQRFFLGWSNARRLIEGCGRLAPAHGFVAGAGTDHLGAIGSARDLIDGVVFQARFIQRHGGIPIVLPMPWLARSRCSEQEYVDVHSAIVRELDGPLYVHWLGEMFHADLAGYFPGDSFRRVMALDPGKVRGAKLSLLDARREVALRRELLARDQVLLTGDDFHFARLLLGGESEAAPGAGGASAASVPPILRRASIGGRDVALGDFSHALLGILDAISLPAARAFAALARGDAGAFLAILDPCEELGRHLFAPPTRHYKAGLAFLAWLDGEQDNAMLVNHEERARGRDHLRRAAELAAAAGALANRDLAADRLAEFEARDPE